MLQAQVVEIVLDAQTDDSVKLARKLDGLYDAVADGLRTPGLKERL